MNEKEILAAKMHALGDKSNLKKVWQNAKLLRILTIVLSMALFILNALPFLSNYVGSTVTSDLVIRGYNFMEFSPWGAVLIISPVLIPLVLTSESVATVKEIILIILLVGTEVCYMDCFNAVRVWFNEIVNSPVIYYPAALTYPVILVATVITAVFYCRSQNEELP